MRARSSSLGLSSRSFSNPLHPYTEGLLKSIPRWADSGKTVRRLESVPGTVPDPRRLPSGCAFQPRCKDDRGDPCGRAPIPLTTPQANRQVRCVKHVLRVWISFSKSFVSGCFVTGRLSRAECAGQFEVGRDQSGSGQAFGTLYPRSRRTFDTTCFESRISRLAYLAYFFRRTF